MNRIFFAICAGAASAAAGFAQAPAPAQATAPLQFEVATIKLARGLQEQVLSGKPHIGMKVDRAQVDIGAFTLSDILERAFKVKTHQIVGPDFLKADRFDVMAKLPEGATEEQIPQMLQSLLAERFKLTYHRETREQALYALVVAKGGPKLKDAPPDPVETADPPKEDKGAMVMDTGQGKVSIKQDGKGGAVVSGGKNGNARMTMENGTMHMEMSKVGMSELAEALTRFVGKTVVDMTELKGNYQVLLDLSMEDLQNAARAAGVNLPIGGRGGADASKPPDDAATPEGSLFTSIERMGLKLESRKMPTDTIVIDHIEKMPTEN